MKKKKNSGLTKKNQKGGPLYKKNNFFVKKLKMFKSSFQSI